MPPNARAAAFARRPALRDALGKRYPKMRNTNTRAVSPKRRLKNDLILISALLCVLLLVGLCLLFLQKEGDTVSVSVNGELYGSYSIYEDRVVEIPANGGSNRLVIRDGKAFIEAADCPDGICAAHRPISGTRQSIVCLPHGVVISIVRVGDADAPDVVV